MTTDRYTTRDDAIFYAIAPVLDVPGVTNVDDFNAIGIFEEAFTREDGGYRQTATGRDFWAIVDKHAI